MMSIQFVVFACAVLIASTTAKCPSGGEIYARGVTSQGRTDVLKAHNHYRNLIMQGRVPGQPKGVGLKTMTYDNKIANAGRIVSDSCEMKHIIAKDGRFHVGQNLYISWSSTNTECSTNQNWTRAVEAWYNEHEDFIYPTGKKSGRVVGHYTQVVWADTHLIGCDFIAFEDKNQPQFPCAKLYTCNYGPGGNYRGQAPYSRA